MYRFRPFTKRFFSTAFQSQLENVGPIASKLRSRAVVRFRGPDTVKFLQGLVTNDVVRGFGDEKSSLPTPNVPYISTRPMYAVMLTAQGRFLYDMFLYKQPPEDEKLDESGSRPGPGSNELVLLADVDCDVVDEFLDSLKK